MRPIILVSGLTDPRHITELHASAAGVPSSLIPASPSLGIELGRERSACLDMTALADMNGLVASCRNSAIKGQLVLLRDHQLGFDEVLRVINDLELHCIVLYTAIS